MKNYKEFVNDLEQLERHYHRGEISEEDYRNSLLYHKYEYISECQDFMLNERNVEVDKDFIYDVLEAVRINGVISAYGTLIAFWSYRDAKTRDTVCTISEFDYMKNFEY